MEKKDTALDETNLPSQIYRNVLLSALKAAGSGMNLLRSTNGKDGANKFVLMRSAMHGDNESAVVNPYEVMITCTTSIEDVRDR
jgi:hypothetical protein